MIGEKSYKLIDFTFENRSFNHNFQMLDKLDNDGFIWEIAGWYKDAKEGDYLVLGLNYNDNRLYRIESINYDNDRSRKFRAIIKFIDKENAPKEYLHLLNYR